VIQPESQTKFLRKQSCTECPLTFNHAKHEFNLSNRPHTSLSSWYKWKATCLICQCTIFTCRARARACVCVRARARARVCEEFITWRPILYILNLINIISEFCMVAEFLILGLQKYFPYGEYQMYVIYLHTELHMPVCSGLISYRYKTASYRIFSRIRSLLVVHSIKYSHIFAMPLCARHFKALKNFAFCLPASEICTSTMLLFHIS